MLYISKSWCIHVVPPISSGCLRDISSIPSLSVVLIMPREYIVKISRGIVQHACKVIPFRFVKVGHTIPSKKYNNKFPIIGTKFVPIGIPTICWYTMHSNFKLLCASLTFIRFIFLVQKIQSYLKYNYLKNNCNLLKISYWKWVILTCSRK